MIRNERFVDGVCMEAEIIDLRAGTYAVERNGVVKFERPLTDDEIEAYTPKPDPRETAISKLQALGLTEHEAIALVGRY